MAKRIRVIAIEFSGFKSGDETIMYESPDEFTDESLRFFAETISHYDDLVGYIIDTDGLLLYVSTEDKYEILGEEAL